MPELPEVETTVKGLYPLINKKIIKIKLYTKKLRYIVPKGIKAKFCNQKFSKIFRIGKYIIIDTDTEYSIIFTTV